MTELNESNKKIYLELCKTVWDLDDKSLDYIDKRISDEWEPVPELKSLINSSGAVYEDQRIRFNIDMKNSTVQSFFEQTDDSYSIFKSKFPKVLSKLRDDYGCCINYGNFIENKVIFKKNLTKIKKVFETVYSENHSLFERETCRSYSEETCADYIVKCFERIGASKKSAKDIQFVISFNPMDWLLASTSESFSSCFNLDNKESGGYQYCLGLPFLCGDKNRMMLYITNGKKKEFQGIKVDSVQTRTWCILDKKGSFNIVKWYPNDTVGVAPVVAITGNSNFKNRDTFSRGKYPIDVISTKKGILYGVYSDMGKLTNINDELFLEGNGKDGQQIFTKNLVELSGRRHTLYIGDGPRVNSFGISSKKFRIPEWKKLGLHIDMMAETLRCSKCGEDRFGFSLGDGKFYCSECYKNNVSKCGHCGREFIKDGTEHTVETTDGRIITLCEECYKEAKNHICSCCGKYSVKSLKTTNDGNKICEDCLKKNINGYSECEECGKISNNSVRYYNTFTHKTKTLCENCKKENSEGVSVFGRYYKVLSRKRIIGGMPVE